MSIVPDRSESRRDDPIERALNRLLSPEVTVAVAVAESCTGGAVAARIVSVSGSSDYFMGGIVSYSNASKQRLLGVPAEILASRGAVSPECAAAMAEGARRAFRADVAVSTTGIAGPGGATARKPVGLVYIALATPAGAEAHEHHFTGDRAAVIAAATEAALRLLLRGVQDAVKPDIHLR
jgi:PncC family amidohydrolase